MQIHWLQVIVFFVLGAFFGPWVFGLIKGRSQNAPSGGGY